MEIGYNLSSEEHSPNDLVKNARRAEAAGFTFALISDHYHPWLDLQGHSSFVWSVIGAIAHSTRNLRLGTASPVQSCASTRRSSPRQPPPQLT
jgi:alkanesulfonate monooxygenase SsuD/methylene tetrahydromethanopterin reductase-like flavin-dependent oxidoreductase (luciferase family)